MNHQIKLSKSASLRDVTGGINGYPVPDDGKPCILTQKKEKTMEQATNNTVTLATFQDLARFYDSFDDFFKITRNIHNVPDKVAQEFYQYYGKDGDNRRTPEEALRVFYDDVRSCDPSYFAKSTDRCSRLKNRPLKEIANDIRKELKLAFPDCKFSVRRDGSRALFVALMAAPFDAFVDDAKHCTFFDERSYENPIPGKPAGFMGQAIITRKAWDVMKKVVKIVERYNWDYSDAMTDYFDVNFYDHFEIGQWDKPFIKTERKEYKMKKTRNKDSMVIVDGRSVDFDAAVELMDDDIREEMHAYYDAISDQDFVNEYCRRHKDKFGEHFEVS